MKRFVKWAAAVLAVAGVAIWAGLPALLVALGFHPHYEAPDLNLEGRRALIVTTSQNTLEATGDATGVFASEMTAPYYTFVDAGMQVDIASIAGGQIPIEPGSLDWPLASAFDRRYRDDPQFQSKVSRSYDIAMVDIQDYDIVFLSGGWGAAYDFAQSPVLGRKMTEAYGEGAIIGGVCHGPLGLLQATTPTGEPLVAGRRLTAVTDKQVAELGITHTPKHPERDLRAAGAVFESATAFRDIFANHVVVDGQLVTGQNQNAGAETAAQMMQALLSRSGTPAAP